MRWLVRFLPSGSPRAQFLSSLRALAKSVGAEARNPKWTSHGALELDLFCPTEADFAVFLSVIEPLSELEFSRDLNLTPPHKPEAEVFAEAREYFNAERYWECHEVLEGVWRQKQGREKSFLQGVILVCAAFVHHQKGEERVALGLLRRAATQLDFPSETYGGLNVEALSKEVGKILETGVVSNFRV